MDGSFGFQQNISFKFISNKNKEQLRQNNFTGCLTPSVYFGEYWSDVFSHDGLI